MMYKKYRNYIFYIFIIFALFGVLPQKKASASTLNNIIILYDSYTQYGEDKNILNYVNEMALSFGGKVDIVNFNDFKDELFRDYSSVIILSNDDNSLSKDMKYKIKNFKGTIFWIGKNYGEFKGQSNITHIGLNSLNSSTQKKIFKAFNEKEVWIQKKYFILDNVNPFIDLNELVNKIDYLNSHGIQFFISAIPIFENTDFNAMKRFAEVLRYAQCKGGYVILHSPYIMEKSAPSEDIINKSEIGYQNYLNYLIYPLGFDIPDFFLYRDDMKQFLEKTNTIFISDDEGMGVQSPGYFKNIKFDNVINKVDYTKINNIKYRDFKNIAISVDNSIPYDKFKNIVDELRNLEIYFNDPRYLNIELKINNNTITSGISGTFLDGSPVTQNNFISRDDFAKAVEKSGSLEENKKLISIEKPKKIIIIIAVSSSIIFLIIVILSRKKDKRKYFK
ncbi:DUF2334 domain-containing protein [Clostridium sardiniense]|uniref:DUF2334 domain-containing protein n=1 Tax=Clostridium sardiniense TaxID=29369 RepID=UPI003D34CC9D